MHTSVVLCTALLLAGCASQQMLWLRADGQRISGNPVLTQEAEMAKTVCLGERQKAALSGVTFAGGGLAGVAAAIDRGNAADQVAQGCMAQQGYVLVPEDHAEAKSAELAAINAQKQQQAIAAVAPPPAKRR